MASPECYLDQRFGPLRNVKTGQLPSFGMAMKFLASLVCPEPDGVLMVSQPEWLEKGRGRALAKQGPSRDHQITSLSDERIATVFAVGNHVVNQRNRAG